jgi:hypothetical protein
MSIAEMKLAAISEISQLNNERELKEILEHLSRLSLEKKEQELNLFQQPILDYCP